MADAVDSDTITIEIPEDSLPQQAEPVVAKVVAPEQAPVVREQEQGKQTPSDDPDKAVAELRSQLTRSQEERDRMAGALSEESIRRQAAERLVERTAVDSNAAAAREIETNTAAIASSLSAAKTSLSSLKQSYSAALKEGDFDKAAEIQVDMSTTGARIVALEGGQHELAARKEALKAQPVRQQPRQFQFSQSQAWDGEEFEAYLRTRTPQTAAWLRSNPKYASDPSYRSRVVAAHNYAVAKGAIPDTSDYFKIVEDSTNQGQASRAEQVMTQDTPRDSKSTSSAAATVARSNPVPAAPVSRSVPNAAPGGRVPITLTRDEQEIARLTLRPEIIGKNPDGTPKDPLVVYAQNKAAQQRDGSFRTETKGGPTYVPKDSQWSR
jgi:hypothetical protein